MEKVYKVRAVAEVCKLHGGRGTHRRSGIDFGIEPALVSGGDHDGAVQLDEDDLEAVLLDDLLVFSHVDPDDDEPEDDPDPDRAALELRYEEIYGQKPHPKMKLQTLIDRVERGAE